jgi:hypothetical protein
MAVDGLARRFTTASAVATMGLLVCACEAPGTNDYNPPPLPEGGGGADASTGPVSLPFLVSEQFEPTGAMGDSPTNIMGVSISSDSSQCLQPRVTGAQGTCFTFAWKPVILTGQTSAWAGLYWQYPGGNWGTSPGLPIKPGATRVTFAAAGVQGGEQVQFIVGGINTTASDAGLAYADTFKATKLVTLTKAWQTFEIPLNGAKYTDVLGGFAWAITAGGTGRLSFYVDDIEWQP